MRYVYLLRSESSRGKLRRRHIRPKAAADGAQCKRVAAHRQIHSLEIGDLLLRFQMRKRPRCLNAI